MRKQSMAVVGLSVVLAACSAGTGEDSSTESASVTNSIGTPPSVAGTSAHGQGENGEPARIDIQVGGQTVAGTMNDSAASRDLLALLPLTLTLSDHGAVEKTGPLPAELSTDGAPWSADPDPGDIGYYAPGNDFVLYYGDQSEYPGIVILGTMDASGADAIGSIDGDVTVTVTRSQ